LEGRVQSRNENKNKCKYTTHIMVTEKAGMCKNRNTIYSLFVILIGTKVPNDLRTLINFWYLSSEYVGYRYKICKSVYTIHMFHVNTQQNSYQMIRHFVSMKIDFW
jgi:hypothetical protein